MKPCTCCRDEDEELVAETGLCPPCALNEIKAGRCSLDPALMARMGASETYTNRCWTEQALLEVVRRIAGGGTVQPEVARFVLDTYKRGEPK